MTSKISQVIPKRIKASHLKINKLNNRKVKLNSQLALHLLMSKVQINRKLRSLFYLLLYDNISQMQVKKTTGMNCTSQSPTKKTWPKRTSRE